MALLWLIILLLPIYAIYVIWEQPKNKAHKWISTAWLLITVFIIVSAWVRVDELESENERSNWAIRARYKIDSQYLACIREAEETDTLMDCVMDNVETISNLMK